VHEIREFRIPAVTIIVLCCKIVRNYITYDVPVEPHKTRRRSRTPFSMYTFENSDSTQRDGENY
jgi:hypothetical protein